MDLNQLTTLEYWNGLVLDHLPTLVMALTAVVVVVLDRYVRRFVTQVTKSFNIVSRFMVFLLLCSIGYAVLAVGVAWALKMGITLSGGLYAAPSVMVLLLVVAIEAQRQRLA